MKPRIFYPLGALLSCASLYAIDDVNYDGLDLTIGDTVSIDWANESWQNGSFDGTIFSTQNNAAYLWSVDFTGSSFVGADFSYADISYVDFSNADLDSAIFTAAHSGGFGFGTTFNAVRNFTNAQLLQLASVRRVNLTNLDGQDGVTSMAGWDFTGVAFGNMERASFAGSDVSGADFSGVHLTNVNFAGTDASNATFDGATLWGSSVGGAQFSQTDLTNASFTNTSLYGVAFAGAKGLTEAQLNAASSVDSVRLLNQNGSDGSTSLAGWDFTSVANQSMTHAWFAGSDLTNANFTGVDLTGATFTSYSANPATVMNANFTNANLSYARLDLLNLVGVVFTGADLSHARFDAVMGLTEAQLNSATNLNYVELTNLDGQSGVTTLANWDFTGVAGLSLLGAKFDGSDVANADFTGVDLTAASFDAVKGLTAAQLQQVGNLTAVKLTNLDGANGVVNLSTWDFSPFAGTSLLDNVTFDGSNLSGVDFTGFDFSHASFGDVDASNASFANTTVYAASFAGADVSNVSFVGAQLFQDGGIGGTDQSTDFGGADVAGADFTGVDLTGVNFSGVSGLTDTQILSASSVVGINLSGLDGNGAASLAGWDFSTVAGQDLEGVNFSGSDLSGASFGGVSLRLVAFDGVKNLTLTQLLAASDLYGVGLRDLDGANGVTSMAGWDFTVRSVWDSVGFSGSNLDGAKFEGVQIVDSAFYGSSLVGANFKNAVLTETYITNDGLTEVKADLTNADLTGATLSGSIISGVKLGGKLSNGVTLTGDSQVTLSESVTVQGAGQLSVLGTSILRLNEDEGAQTTFKVTDLTLSDTATLTLNDNRLEVLNVIGNLNLSDGVYAPGASPAASTVSGDLTIGAASSIEFEIAGTTPGSEFDTLHVGGNATIDGTVEVVILGGWSTLTSALAASSGAPVSFDLLDVDGTFSVGGSLSFDFGAYGLESGVIWDTSDFGTDGTIDLIAVPEPATYALLLGLGAVVCVAVRRRR